jgi:hypothetical protein
MSLFPSDGSASHIHMGEAIQSSAIRVGTVQIVGQSNPADPAKFCIVCRNIIYLFLFFIPYLSNQVQDTDPIKKIYEEFLQGSGLTKPNVSSS